MSKEMNIREVMANIREGQGYRYEDIIIRCTVNGDIEIYNCDNGNGFGFTNQDKFIKVEEPVSFYEVVCSDKQCRVEHEIINDYLSTEDIDTLQKYDELKCILKTLSQTISNKGMKTIMKEGKWYLQD